VTQSTLDQSQGYWLLHDIVVVAIAMRCMMENNNLGVIDPMHVNVNFVLMFPLIELVVIFLLSNLLILLLLANWGL
jgi:hypothetical protein